MFKKLIKSIGGRERESVPADTSLPGTTEENIFAFGPERHETFVNQNLQIDPRLRRGPFEAVLRESQRRFSCCDYIALTGNGSDNEFPPPDEWFLPPAGLRNALEGMGESLVRFIKERVDRPRTDRVIHIELYGDPLATSIVTRSLNSEVDGQLGIEGLIGDQRSGIVIQTTSVSRLQRDLDRGDSPIMQTITAMKKDLNSPIAIVVIKKGMRYGEIEKPHILGDVKNDEAPISGREELKLLEKSLLSKLASASSLDIEKPTIVLIEVSQIPANLTGDDLLIGIPSREVADYEGVEFIGVPKLKNDVLKEAFIYPSWRGNKRYCELVIGIAGESVDWHRRLSEATAQLCMENAEFSRALEEGGEAWTSELEKMWLEKVAGFVLKPGWEEEAPALMDEAGFPILLQRVLLAGRIADPRTGLLPKGWEEVVIGDILKSNREQNESMGAAQETDPQKLGREWLRLMFPHLHFYERDLPDGDPWMTSEKWQEAKNKFYGFDELEASDEAIQKLVIPGIYPELVRLLQIMHGEGIMPDEKIARANQVPEGTTAVCDHCGGILSEKDVVMTASGGFQWKDEVDSCRGCGSRTFELVINKPQINN